MREPGSTITSRPTRNSRSTDATDGDGGRLLAQAMSVNALFSVVSGAVLATLSWALDGVFGPPAWLLTAVGLGLLAFAAGLIVIMARPRLLGAGGRAVICADLTWVVAAVVLLALQVDGLTAIGRLTLGVVSAVVAVLAVWQAIGLRRIGTGPPHGASQVRIAASRTVDAAVAQVWDAIADAGGYAAFADGIADTHVDGPPGDGMSRVCTDERGDQWSETCTLWDEHRTYTMTVDTSTYPARLRWLLHAFQQTWTVEPSARGARVTLRFDAAVKLGVIGRLAVAAMGRGDPAGRVVDAYGRHLGADVRRA